MKLEKAIEILKQPGIPWNGEALQRHYAARQLGIEALKRIQATRNHQSYRVHPFLPGETEE